MSGDFFGIQVATGTYSGCASRISSLAAFQGGLPALIDNRLTPWRDRVQSVGGPLNATIARLIARVAYVDRPLDARRPDVITRCASRLVFDFSGSLRTDHWWVFVGQGPIGAEMVAYSVVGAGRRLIEAYDAAITRRPPRKDD